MGGAEPLVAAYRFGDAFDYSSFCVLMSVAASVIGFSMLLISRLEKKLHLAEDYFKLALLHGVLHELTTLGIISFALFVVDEIWTLDHNSTFYTTFEFCHYVIFFLAVNFALSAWLLGAASLSTKAQWDRASYVSLDAIVGEASIEKRTFFERLELKRVLEFHISRCAFIAQQGRERSFNFYGYVSRVNDGLVLRIIKGGWLELLLLLASNWIAVLCLIPGQGIDAHFFSPRTGFVFSCLLLCLAILQLLFTQLAFWRAIDIINDSASSATTGSGASWGNLDRAKDAVGLIWVQPLTFLQHRVIKHSRRGMDLISPVEDYIVEGSSSFDGDSLPTGANDESPAEGCDHVRDSLRKMSLLHLMQSTRSIASTLQDHMLSSESIWTHSSDRVVLTSIKFAMLCNNFMLSLWAAYWVGWAVKEQDQVIFSVLIPIPLVMASVLTFATTLPMFSLLHAMCVLYPEEAAEVESETADIEQMRRDLLARLDHAMRIEFEAHKTAGSPTERGTKDHIDYFLDRWDSNRDGHLSFEEARKAFEDLGLNLTNKQHWRLMRAADPDRSGQVDLQELRVFLHQTNEGATSTNAI